MFETVLSIKFNLIKATCLPLHANFVSRASQLVPTHGLPFPDLCYVATLGLTYLTDLHIKASKIFVTRFQSKHPSHARDALLPQPWPAYSPIQLLEEWLRKPLVLVGWCNISFPLMMYGVWDMQRPVQAFGTVSQSPALAALNAGAVVVGRGIV